MSGENIAENYLARAREAEEQADKTTDGYLRGSWQRIAKSYRQMAQNILDGLPATIVSTSGPSPLPQTEPRSEAGPDRTKIT